MGEEMRSKRRRLDSSGQELGSGSEETLGETKRREPAHRRKNRQRVKQQQKQHNALAPPYVYDDAEIEALQQEGGMERSMIEVIRILMVVMLVMVVMVVMVMMMVVMVVMVMMMMMVTVMTMVIAARRVCAKRGG